MKILALETSSNACSAALLTGNLQDFSCIERFEIAPRQHTQLILPMIDSLLLEADYSLQQINALAFSRGPGAFTGVRVATGVTQAIAFGADLPVAQISSLAAVAQGIVREHFVKHERQRVLVANDARIGEIYFAAYENDAGEIKLIGQEQVMRPEGLMSYLEKQQIVPRPANRCFCAGSGWDAYADSLQSVLELSSDTYAESWPHARDVAFLAIREVENSTLVNAESVSPVYLRDNVAKKPTAAV